jgi:hypothetical protein
MQQTKTVSIIYFKTITIKASTIRFDRKLVKKSAEFCRIGRSNTLVFEFKLQFQLNLVSFTEINLTGQISRLMWSCYFLQVMGLSLRKMLRFRRAAIYHLNEKNNVSTVGYTN